MNKRERVFLNERNVKENFARKNHMQQNQIYPSHIVFILLP
jgi:hypothetical protein